MIIFNYTLKCAIYKNKNHHSLAVNGGFDKCYLKW